MDKYRLKLFITGQTSRSSRAIANLRRICEDELGTEYELNIIDVLRAIPGTQYSFAVFYWDPTLPADYPQTSQLTWHA